MTRSYAELQAEIAELKRQADTARSAEIAGAKAEIAQIMLSHGLTIADLGTNAGPAKAKKASAPVAVKYKDPDSGATWTGRGRAPLWLSGKEKNDFLIK